MFTEHTATDGICESCRQDAPCAGRALALAGLGTAIGHTNNDTDYWISYVTLLLAQGRRSA